MNDDKNYAPPLYFDEKTQTPQIKAIKAAIPYMEPSMGKMAALMVKFMEIKMVMETFETEIAVQTNEPDKGIRMLEAIRPYCGDELVKAADFIERAAEVRKMAEMMGALNVQQGSNDGGGNNDGWEV